MGWMGYGAAYFGLALLIVFCRYSSLYLEISVFNASLHVKFGSSVHSGLKLASISYTKKLSYP